MKINFIIPTLGNREFELRRVLKTLVTQVLIEDIEIEAIIINQGRDLSLIIDEFGKSNIAISCHKVNFKGLSKARNYAFQFCKGDVIVLADDDCWYPQDAVSKIINTHIKYPHELIAFKIYDKLNNIPYKKYKKEMFDHSWFTLFTISSIEITFKRSILESGLAFNEKFGLGAEHPSGEELIFCKRVLEGGAKMRYIPEIVAYHEKKEDPKLLKLGGGELFYELFHYNSIWIYLIFLIKQLAKNVINPFQVLYRYIDLLKILKQKTLS
ncbi:MAG: glycosyltransferase family 2 protein [Bacteroidota bacterium]